MTSSSFVQVNRSAPLGDTSTGKHSKVAKGTHAMQSGAMRNPRSCDRSARSQKAHPHGRGYSARCRGESHTAAGMATGDGEASLFKAQFKDMFGSTTGRYAKAAWQHAIAAVPEGGYRPITELVSHESVSSRYGPSEVSIAPSQNRSTTPTLPRPGLSAALCDRAVRRPLTEANYSSAILADAVTQTVCEASAQTVEEDTNSCQDRVISIPWGRRPDGSTPIIVPVKEVKALTKCIVKTSRKGMKRGNVARQRKGAKTGSCKEEQKTSAERRPLKDQHSETWTIPVSPQQAVQPRRQSGKPFKTEPVKAASQRPLSANAAINTGRHQHCQPAATPGSQVLHDMQPTPRCTSCGACCTDQPQSTVASLAPTVHDSPRVLQPLPMPPSTPVPTATSLAPISPPPQSAAPLLSAAPDSPRGFPVVGGCSQHPAVSLNPVPCSEHEKRRPHPYEPRPCLSQADDHRSVAVQISNSPSHNGRCMAPTPRDAVLDSSVLQNPERQDMVSQLERALADLERDVSQRASEISSVTAPVFNSGLDSLAALEAEISDQHRRLADIGVLMPASMGEPTTHKEPKAMHFATAASPVAGAVSPTPSGGTAASDWRAGFKSAVDSWAGHNLTSSSGQVTPSITHSDTPSTMLLHCARAQQQHSGPVASSVSRSELQPSSYNALAAISYLSKAPGSLLNSDYSEVSAQGATHAQYTTSQTRSRTRSESPDGGFSSVSIEDRLTRMGLSEQISQLVRDMSAETDSVCSLPQHSQDSFPWLRGVATNSDTSSTVTLPPLGPPQPLSFQDCLRPSSTSPDALSDCRSSSMQHTDLRWRGLNATGTRISSNVSAAPRLAASSPSPPPSAYELTFASAAAKGRSSNMSTPSDASSSPASSPTVANKAHSMPHRVNEHEPPFQVHVRGLSQRDCCTRDSESTDPAAIATSGNNNSVCLSSAVATDRDSSVDRASRASSARSASLNPAAGSSWQEQDDRGSLTSRSQSPELSTTTPSTRTPEQHTGVDLSLLSPLTPSDVGDSASLTATPTDLAADADSFLCTSFWAS